MPRPSWPRAPRASPRRPQWRMLLLFSSLVRRAGSLEGPCPHAWRLMIPGMYRSFGAPPRAVQPSRRRIQAAVTGRCDHRKSLSARPDDNVRATRVWAQGVHSNGMGPARPSHSRFGSVGLRKAERASEPRGEGTNEAVMEFGSGLRAFLQVGDFVTQTEPCAPATTPERAAPVPWVQRQRVHPLRLHPPRPATAHAGITLTVRSS